MGKVILNEEKCLGCGACCSIAQENFEFNDEGKASLINDTITNEAIEASEMCPTRAITIEECNCCNNCDDNYSCIDDDCCCEDCNCETNCTCGDNCNCTDECNCGCKN